CGKCGAIRVSARRQCKRKTCEAMAAQTLNHRYEGVFFLSMRPQIHALVKATGHSPIANRPQFGECPRPKAARAYGRLKAAAARPVAGRGPRPGFCILSTRKTDPGDAPVTQGRPR